MSGNAPSDASPPPPASGDRLINFLDLFLAELHARGLVETDHGQMRLSAAGRAVVGERRRSGVTDQDFMTVLKLLARAVELEVPRAP